MIILNGKKEEHLNMLEGGIIQRLLEEKWQSFARREFLRKLLIMMLQLLVLSVAVYLRPLLSTPRSLQTADDVLRLCFEVITLLGCCYYLVIQTGSEIKNQGFLPFVVQLYHDPVQLAFNLSNLCLLACIPLRLFDVAEVEDVIVTLAIPGYWLYLMFFAGAIQLTGPFVTMVFKIITNDMVTFFIIYSVFLLAFTQAFHFLYKGIENPGSTRFSSYLDTWMGLFQMTLGDYDFAELSRSPYSGMLLLTFVLFMVLMPILLLNMLIAMMGNTYANVVQQSEKEWVKQWANIVITLERGLGSEKCKSAMEAYSLQLPGGMQRGVMVIKTKSKTKARQRKGALTNWKRVGTVTLRTLKRRKMSGEQLRREMWGLDSASSTPRKKRTKPGYEIGTRNGAPIGDSISSALQNLAESQLTSQNPKLPPIKDVNNDSTNGETSLKSENNKFCPVSTATLSKYGHTIQKSTIQIPMESNKFTLPRITKLPSKVHPFKPKEDEYIQQENENDNVYSSKKMQQTSYGEVEQHIRLKQPPNQQNNFHTSSTNLTVQSILPQFGKDSSEIMNPQHVVPLDYLSINQSSNVGKTEPQFHHTYTTFNDQTSQAMSNDVRPETVSVSSPLIQSNVYTSQVIALNIPTSGLDAISANSSVVRTLPKNLSKQKSTDEPIPNLSETNKVQNEREKVNLHCFSGTSMETFKDFDEKKVSNITCLDDSNTGSEAKMATPSGLEAPLIEPTCFLPAELHRITHISPESPSEAQDHGKQTESINTSPNISSIASPMAITNEQCEDFTKNINEGNS